MKRQCALLEMLHSSSLLRGVLFLFGGAWSLGSAQNVAPGDATQPVEEVVVTGFRASLNESLDFKRDAVGSVDAIFAEDIAKFSDLNLAEAIQRIPGVAIAR